MGNSQKLATQGTPDEENQNKKHNTICAGHNYAQANTINVKKNTLRLQPTRGNDEPNMVFMRKS